MKNIKGRLKAICNGSLVFIGLSMLALALINSVRLSEQEFKEFRLEVGKKLVLDSDTLTIVDSTPFYMRISNGLIVSRELYEQTKIEQ